MFVLKRLALLVLIFSFMFAIGVDVYAHMMHDSTIPDLSFTSDPDISCNIDGSSFTRLVEKDADGNVVKDVWLYETGPQDPIVKIEASTHGMGWAHILLYGNAAGESFGDTVNTHAEQLGSWIGFLPFFTGGNNDIGWEDYGSFNTDPGEYSWDASGSVKLVPVFWKWSFSYPLPGGSWEEASSDFHTTKDASDGGGWNVQLIEASVVASVTHNGPNFSVYDPLQVTVKHDDLYYVNLLIDDECRATDSGTEVNLTYYLHSGDVGNHTVRIKAFYGDGRESEHSFTITVNN